MATGGTDRYLVEQRDVGAEVRPLADHQAGPVTDREAGTDVCARSDFDAGQQQAEAAEQWTEERPSTTLEPMRDAMEHHGLVAVVEQQALHRRPEQADTTAFLKVLGVLSKVGE